MGHGRRTGAATGSASSTSRSPSWTARSTRRWSTCSGSAARARWRTGRARPPRRSPRCCTPAGVKFAVLGPGRDLHRRPGPADRQRVRVLDAGPAEHRDAERGGRAKTIVASCPHCFNTIAESTRSSAGTTRSSTTPSCWPRWSPTGKLKPGRAGGGEAHLPRPVLPGPAQQGLHPAAGDHRRRSPACRPPRCTGARNAGSAAARAARGCGWKSASASGSTPSGSRKPSRCTPDTISTVLPVLPGHARRRRQPRRRARGDAKDTLEVVDVAQLLARSVRTATPVAVDGDSGTDGTSGGGERAGTARSEDTRSSPPSRSRSG